MKAEAEAATAGVGERERKEVVVGEFGIENKRAKLGEKEKDKENERKKILATRRVINTLLCLMGICSIYSVDCYAQKIA